MQNERQDFDDDDLAEIWRSAQHRRAEDIYSWFTHFLNKRWRLKSTGRRPQHAVDHSTKLWARERSFS
jgi:hypothetical protein